PRPAASAPRPRPRACAPPLFRVGATAPWSHSEEAIVARPFAAQRRRAAVGPRPASARRARSRRERIAIPHQEGRGHRRANQPIGPFHGRAPLFVGSKLDGTSRETAWVAR